MKIAIVGAGITGLTVAYRLSQKNHQVVVFEKAKSPGGLAAGFREDSWQWSLENFFHHLFVSDIAAKDLISELNLSARLFYLRPKTAVFKNGQISQFDSPFSVLRFPYLSFPEKIRTGVVTAYLKSTSDWQKFEKITASQWLKKYYGRKPYEIIWQPLLEAKFGLEASKISMAWFWARIKKRSSQLGYLRGGFQILIDQLVKKIKENRGELIFNREIRNLKELRKNFDKVVITVPAQKFFRTELPKMIGALNLILVLKEKFLPDGTYWLNINEPNSPFVAVVEHTNFVSPKYYGASQILYVGGYYPQNHRYFKMTKRQIFQEFLPYLKKINPQFNPLNTKYLILNTSLFAQPVIPLYYSKLIAKMEKPAPDVYLANMQMVYPWDRGINYAVEMGEKVANEILKI